MIVIDEAVRRSGYCHEHLRRLLRTGKILGEKIATVWTVDEQSLNEYVIEAKNNRDRRYKK